MAVADRMLLQRIVKDACMKHIGYTGSTYYLALEFAEYASEALKKGDTGWLDDIINTYVSMGLPLDLLQSIVNRLKKKYTSEGEE
ncbi:hypothetical protein [Candidatus Methanodesulfokora washburnensis]|nr:hypothetical protein [Candidatus Methanodesulfokores washburnensis]